MPKLPLPVEADELLRRPNYAVIATIREDGSPYTAATWYDWDGERVLVNMDASRVRLRHLRRDSRVSLTVLDGESWYRHLTVFGHAVEIVADPDLVDIDRLAQRYAGRPHGDRTRDSVSAWIELDGWYGWEGATTWPASVT
jgi:PPOX class probable F420-dependent enzyme